MDDLLTRMLAIDKQGNAVVEAAEAEAVKIREAASAAQAQETEAFSAKLSEELEGIVEGIEQAAVASAEAEREKELSLVSEQLPARAAAFREALSGQEGRLLKVLLGAEG